MTSAEELVLIDAAITNILTVGQAYSISGRALTKADLKFLYERKKELTALIATGEATGSTINKVTFNRPV